VDKGVGSLLAHIERTQLAPSHLLQHHTLEYDLPKFLRQVLGDQNWFAPAEPPSISAALTTFFMQAYAGRAPDLDPIYPGERARASAIEQRYYDEPYEPWESRDSRQHVERMIAASGRVTPYRLRPLVLTKSNAAKKEWHYGAWGVYDVLPTGEVGAFLALYGRSAVGQEHTWHKMLWDEGRFPQPEPEVAGLDVVWYGLYLEREYPRYSFPEIRCAMTGALLAEWSPTPAADERPPEAFLPVEVTLPPLGEDDVYSPARADLRRDREA
jgi:hypothetical protein